MQTIIRFGAKKGFQAFPVLASFGSIGNELGSEQGLYLPASIIKSHASLAQQHHAEGIERCLVYSKRSSLQKYHVLALIMPVDAGKPEWRDGAFIGVAMLVQGQMIREKEALAVLEADLKELLTEHPISSGREESAEPLNWKASGRSVPISLFSPWQDDLTPRSAQLIPAKSNEGPWHSRVSSALDSATNLERQVILPYHEAAPNISGWNAPPATGTSNPQPAPPEGDNTERPMTIAVPNDDIKRLSDALEHEQKLNERLTAETTRLKQANQRQNRNRWVALAATGAIALCIGGGAGWMVSKKKAPTPAREETIQIQKEFGPHQYYWESLAFRSKHPSEAKKFKVYPGEAFLENVLVRDMSVYDATLNTESAGSDFFEWRLKDLKSVLSSHHPSRSISDDLLCIPCLKYGILNYQVGQGVATDSSEALLSFNEMNEALRLALDSAGIEALDNLFRAMQKGLLSNDGPCVAVRKSIKWTSKDTDWREVAFKNWEEADKFNFLTGFARQVMIEDLTDYINPGINDGKQKGDTLVFWVPEIQ
jgi:hypothetical protein